MVMLQDVVLAFNRMLLFIVIMQYFVCYFAYFKDEDDFVPVFALGLVFGLVYFVFPIQKIFGIQVDEELEDGGTGGISWDECMKFTRDSDREDPVGMFNFGLEVYAPRLPEYCTEDYKQRVHEEYKLPPSVHPANPSLLHGQHSDTGGDATLPPNRDQNLRPGETPNPFAHQDIGMQPTPTFQVDPRASVQGPPMYPPPQYPPPQAQQMQQNYQPAPMPYAAPPAFPPTEGVSAYPAASAYPAPANPYAANPYHVGDSIVTHNEDNIQPTYNVQSMELATCCRLQFYALRLYLSVIRLSATFFSNLTFQAPWLMFLF
ncbi:hypothetical protein CYMTET_50746 [Cymbomonas tetramitiformis]|uniref:Uncharacterized protein n=1 Tax=Cymbomonas tetramitiformis TaxID=36881 RepID=A0AAE0EUG2_9CHLO|nr:hypothetical protein CYMTET_50746 [Cymbomonas tetramitiformis]